MAELLLKSGARVDLQADDGLSALPASMGCTTLLCSC